VRKIFRFRFRKNMSSLNPSRLIDRGVRVVTDVGRAAMDVRAAADGRRRHGREVVWSWPPGAEVKLGCFDEHASDGGKTAGPRGERDISVKTVAQGRPVFGQTCGSCPVLFARTGAMGAASFRSSLRPPSPRA
jgi:hypothetical protein